MADSGFENLGPHAQETINTLSFNHPGHAVHYLNSLAQSKHHSQVAGNYGRLAGDALAQGGHESFLRLGKEMNSNMAESEHFRQRAHSYGQPKKSAMVKPKGHDSWGHISARDYGMN